MDTSSFLNILDAETRSILDILNRDSNSSSIWKVLIYDDRGRNILAPIVKLGTLRHHGVTLNLGITEERYSVSDASSIYFVEPNDANIDLICKDLKKDMYQSYHIEFISPISNSKLREFALKAVIHRSRISRIVDRYIDFVALSHNVFTLLLEKTFEILYSPKANDDLIQTEVEKMTDGLLSVIRTLNIKPIIKCPKTETSPAKAVALRLEQRLREIDLNFFPTSQVGSRHHRRVVLVLCDRSFDFQVMIGHTWTYRSLIHDIFGINSNRVTIPKSNLPVELISTDNFWNRNMDMPYPDVAIAVGDLLEEFNRTVKDFGGRESNEDISKTVAAALNAAPEIIEKKRSLDLHTNIAGALLDSIKDRKLDQFYELENNLIDSMFQSSTIAAVGQVEKLITSGNQIDKLRLLLTLHLSRGIQLKNEIDTLFKHIGNEEALYFLRNFETMSTLRYEDDFTTTYSKIPKVTSSPSLAATWGSVVVDKSRNLLLQGVRQLIPAKHEHKIVKLVDDLMTSGPGKVRDTHLILDPLDIGGAAGLEPFKYGVVFVVGGGTYVEAEALTNLAARTERKILYGSNNIDQPKAFAEHLIQLGRMLN